MHTNIQSRNYHGIVWLKMDIVCLARPYLLANKCIYVLNK